MIRCAWLLSLLVVSACGEATEKPVGICGPSGPPRVCPPAKITCTPAPPPPPECSEVLFADISRAFNYRDHLSYRRTLSTDFRFTDETTGAETIGKDREVEIVEQVFGSYRSLEYALLDSSAQEIEDGCLMVCGLIEMKLTNDQYRETGFQINDETCMTVCPDASGSVWRLHEWRVLEQHTST